MSQTDDLASTAPATEQLASGIDLEALDASVRPADDLFRHTNGKWIAATEVPAYLPAYGSFIQLREDAEKAVLDILESGKDAEPGSELRKAADAYAAFMDEEKLEALGFDPVRPDIDRALAASTINEFLHVLGDLERTGLGSFVSAYVYPDLKSPAEYALYFEQSGLGLPDESYYREEQYAEIREQYKAHIARMLDLAGLADAEERAERVFALETRIAALHWDVVKSREAELAYNPRTFDELSAAYSNVDFAGWTSRWGAPAGALDRVIVRQPDFFEGVAGLLTEDHLTAWREWLVWGIASQYSGILAPSVSAANFEFYGKTLQGTPEQRERWKRGTGHAEGKLPEAIGKAYVERHFSPTAKAKMLELVGYLTGAYRASITELEWMSPETRERALDKLEKFVTKIGYPDRWRDYSDLEIKDDDVVGNSRRASVYEAAYEFAKLGTPVRRDEWMMPPQTVNAYYSPGENEIVFPAAILQLPFFDEHRDPAANFGAIGAVIGHEIGHGFDDQGSKYDGDGRLEDWWTSDDRTAFEQRTRALIDQYNELSPEGTEGRKVNGELTIGENIGDLGGLGIAWKAYRAYSADAGFSPDDKNVIDGLTAAQRFFLSWAQAWQQKARPEYAKLLLAVDPHSPAEFRCNQIVRNVDAFYDAFDVTENDALWLAPEARVTIW
ncbi:M13 family metallopeptidase [Pseudoclavibacter helvolus]|uniref:M13 family metallopeptidase n=1 Tax=Pseudoclavibacter helvolus TaxID=255205 RepID=UPI0008382F1B|nr:M13-type metalloendopeptidase [Pseudoclavibacter helvolus]